ncbi:unnamed protein product, partial [Ectocarpus sp. 12 AP-2014]
LLSLSPHALVCVQPPCPAWARFKGRVGERREADFQLLRATSFFWDWRGGWSPTAARPSPWMCPSFLLGPGRSRKSAARRRVATARGTPRKVLLSI